MRFTIQQQGVKRDLEGSFAICATREDFNRLVSELQEALDRPGWIFGWINIYEPVEVVPHSKSRPWKEEVPR